MIVLSWVEVMNSVLVLAKLLKGRQVYGVPRGGALIATLLSYQGCTLARNPLESPFKGTKEKGVVIVDDIADSGGTLGAFAVVGFQTAALIIKGECTPKPNFYAHCITEGDYIAFPFERLFEAIEAETKGAYRTNG